MKSVFHFLGNAANSNLSSTSVITPVVVPSNDYASMIGSPVFESVTIPMIFAFFLLCTFRFLNFKNNFIPFNNITDITPF